MSGVAGAVQVGGGGTTNVGELAQVPGTTWHVSPAGSDTNDGQ